MTFQTTVTFTVTATFDLEAMSIIKEKADTLSDGIIRDVKNALNEKWIHSPVQCVEIDGIKAGNTVVKAGRKFAEVVE